MLFVLILIITSSRQRYLLQVGIRLNIFRINRYLVAHHNKAFVKINVHCSTF